MALDSQDFQLIKTLRAAVEDAGAATTRKLDGVIDAQRKLLTATEKSLTNDERMLDAFNRMAQALEGLTDEVRQLRRDLAPPIEKPKLPTPQQ